MRTANPLAIIITLTAALSCGMGRAEAAYTCDELFSPVTPDFLLADLGNKFGGTVTALSKSAEEQALIIQLKTSYGFNLGELRVKSFSPITNELVIEWMESTVQKMGIGKALLAQALATYPSTKTITTKHLSQVNLAELHRVERAGIPWPESIKFTPAYKIRAQFGFSKLKTDSRNEDDGFSVEKD